MKTKQIEILEWDTQGTELLVRARGILSNAPADKVRALCARIPTEILPTNDRLRVVFAGQYSAGKSTILRALTGRADIVTGAGITTEKTHTYEWSSVELVDTPGVHTKIRPDHDEIAYRAIADADLLVFVITNELFDSYLAEHFRKLAIERDKAHEMMLVVNKMERSAKGNNLETQQIIREDLRHPLSPFSPDDLRTTFIDAEAALESKAENNNDSAIALWKRSGFDLFIDNLNRFVHDNNGLAARYTTALYGLEQILQEALAAEPSGDIDVDALEELLLQRRRALMETQQRIPRAVETKVQSVSAQIRQEGREIADLIHGKPDTKKLDLKLKAAQERVQKHTDHLDEVIELVISSHMKDLDERVGAIAESEFAHELLQRLGKRLQELLASANLSPESLERLKKASDVSRQLGEFLISKSFNPKTTSFAKLLNLNQYSGTAAHETVKTIGRFFGKSFKPWQAVKWARVAANVGRALSVAGTILTFVLQIKEDADAAQLEQDLRESRSVIRSGFNDAAHAIELHYDQSTDAFVANTITKEIETVDAQLAELREMQRSRGQLFQNLVELLKQTRAMIRELHSAVIIS